MGALIVRSATPGWQLAAGHWVPAKIAPVIAHPRPDADMAAWARAARAPAGILWRIPVVVLGGAWPFKYELTAAPSGVTMTETLPSDWLTNGLQDYGIIEWSNPTVGSHSFSVTVTDQDGTVVTRDWTLEVIASDNTTYFIFLDSASGNNANSGTPASPKQTMLGMYGVDKNASTHQGKQIFYRAGTYLVSVIGNMGGDVQQADMGTVKPFVHVAYPGESVTIDGDGTYIDFESGSGDMCWQGFTWVNPEVVESANDRKQFIRTVTSAAARALFFENTFDGGGDTESDSGSNSSCIMFSGSSSSYSAVVRNTFYRCDNMDFVLYYDVFDSVAEGNEVTGGYGGTFNPSWGFFIKGGASGDARITIRANKAIAGTIARPLVFCSEFTGQLKEDVEVCWNNYKGTNSSTAAAGAGGVGWGQSLAGGEGNYGDMWSYRNNWNMPFIPLWGITSGGPFVFEADVIQHSGTYTDGIAMLGSSTVTVTKTSLDATGTSGMLDGTTNLLTGASRTSYLGTDGCEVA